MSINNREDANKYYDEVRRLVNDYIGREGIRPSMLRGYMRPGGDNFNLFIKMSNLQEVNGIDVVLRDTIEDLAGMEEDGVMTFEKFKLYESDEYKVVEISQCLKKGINAATTGTEKAISDYYDTNLGAVEPIDKEEHSFRVDGWENRQILRVIAYNKEEIDIIYENLADFLFNETRRKSIDLPIGVEIPLDRIIDEESFKKRLKSEMLKENDDTKLVEIIENLTDTKFVGIKMEHYIFEGSI